MNRTRELVNGALTVALFTVILLISVYAPVIYIASMWFLPLPFTYYYLKYGLRPTGVALLAAWAICALVATLVALPLAVIFALAGVVMGMCLKKKSSAFYALTGVSFVYIAGFLLVYVGSILFFNINPVDDSIKLVTESLDQVKSIYANIPGSADAAKQIDVFKKQLEYMKNLVPALLVITSVISALITQLVATPILKRLRLTHPVWKPFSEWRLPKSFLYYPLILILLALFVKPDQGYLYIALINLVFIVYLALLIQGTTVLFALGRHRNIPTAVIVIVLILLFFTSVFTTIIVLLGLLDLGMDFRSRLTKKR